MTNLQRRLASALRADKRARELSDKLRELYERADGEGWLDDPTGSSHLNDAARREADAWREANKLKDAALAEHDASASAQGCEPKLGDYVFATKYTDGDPNDAWAVGFYDGCRDERHYVIDGNGKQIRAGGFRRVGKIAGVTGAWMIDVAPRLEGCNQSVNLWDLLAAAPAAPTAGEGK
jgi:hypothetical protein